MGGIIINKAEKIKTYERSSNTGGIGHECMRHHVPGWVDSGLEDLVLTAGSEGKGAGPPGPDRIFLKMVLFMD